MDTAYETKQSSDYSAAIVLYQTRDAYYVIDILNDKYEFPDLLRAASELYAKYPCDVLLIEGKASGKSLIQSLKHNSTLPIKETQPGRDKITRANAITPTCDRRVVKFVKGAWNSLLLDQLLNFPCGHDDLVDCLSSALTECKDYRGTGGETTTHSIDRLHIKKPELAGYGRTFNLRPSSAITKANYLS